MSNLRTGSFGNYYGSYSGESKALNQEQMSVNAHYIFSYLNNEGWSINAISALLGNLQVESSINPGRWQSDNVGNISSGYGLVQWTPSSKYTGWCSDQGLTDPSEMDSNLKRILYELKNNIQWIATNNYDFSFKDFSTSKRSVSDLAKAFLLNYERPADQSESVQTFRAELAESWYSVLQGTEPDSPGVTKKRRSKYNFLLFQSNRRRTQWIKNPLSQR